LRRLPWIGDGLETVPVKKCKACREQMFVATTPKDIQVGIALTIPVPAGPYYIESIMNGVMRIKQSGQPEYAIGRTRVTPHVLVCGARHE
jgi:hypothetical protein